MLRMFNQSVVASSIFFAVVCWGSRLRAADANKISRIIKKAGSVRLENFNNNMKILFVMVRTHLYTLIDLRQYT